MTYSRTAAIRRGRYEATEATGVWTAAYDESGQMFWYDELTHETTYDPSAGRRHPQPHHQTMSHSAFFARGSTSGGGGHMPPQMSPPHDDSDYLMSSGSAACPCAAPPPAAAAACGYGTSSGHMVSARAPSFTELPSCCSSPLHHHHQQHPHQHQQHYHQQHHLHQQQHHHHHHQHGRQGCVAAAAGSSLFNGYRWEECFKMDGKKFWRHKETGAIIHRDPYR